MSHQYKKNIIPEKLKAEFRKGFYPHRPAFWLEDISYQRTSIKPDIEKCLSEIKKGRRQFSYPDHDALVFRILKKVIKKYDLKQGADIGCASGYFPAMQIACGIEKCDIFEIRDLKIEHPKIEVRIEDLSVKKTLKPRYDLITCLSTVEHIGLGRYGDPLDPRGDIQMAENIFQLLKPGGIVLISFPVGKGSVVFNAHRIYSGYRIDQLLKDF
ncbi:MAG: DUF268 domain-containing protein [Spirochaetes bacterium]|nr:DUF268 domain-containing protein [Spirochaetota bacterium]